MYTLILLLTLAALPTTYTITCVDSEIPGWCTMVMMTKADYEKESN